MEQKNYRIFGIRAIMEAIEAGKTLDKIFIQKGLQGELVKKLLLLVKEQEIAMVYVPVEKLNRLSKGNHQGVVANLSPISFWSLESLIEKSLESNTSPLFLVLDQLSDVRNFGAIIRTASCTGVDGIIIAKNGAAPVTADTVKTSAGAVFQVPIAKVDHIKDAIYYLQASDIRVVAATEKSDTEIYEEDLRRPIAMVMGAEDTGVSAGVLKIVDAKAKLPMKGSIASLNVSVACGVFLYECLRQRK